MPFFGSYLGGAVAGFVFYLTRLMFIDCGLYPEENLAAAERPLFGAWSY